MTEPDDDRPPVVTRSRRHIAENQVFDVYFDHVSTPVALRATFGIHLTPSAVAATAYLTITEGPPDRIAQMLIGYGLLQGLVLLRLWRWLSGQPFGPATWAYTFGVAALAISTAMFVQRGGTGILATIAPVIFIFANVFIGGVVLRTLMLALQGRLFPAAVSFRV